jgi:PAS domain S-box-containing protein
MKKKTVILCVDDEPTILESLRIELKTTLENEYMIETAEGGEEALEVLRELLEENYEIALVISDYIMPQIKGDELLRKIHQISPKTLNILLTGQADLEAIGNAIKYARLYRYMAKPWQIEDLRLTVKEAVHSYFLERQFAEQNIQLHKLNEELESLVEQRTAALRLSEEKFAIAFRSSPNPISINRVKDGAFIEVNEAFIQLTGYTPEDLLGQSSHNLPGWLNQGEPANFYQLLNQKGKVQNQEFQFRQKSGDIRTLLLSADLIEIAGETCIICVSQDISDRKKAETEIIRSKDLLSSIFNESADAIFLVNPETLLIQDCNRRAVEMFEAESKEDLLNLEGVTRSKNSCQEEDVPPIPERQDQGFGSKEVEYLTKKGKPFWGNLATKKIYVAGQIINLVRVTDITTRKQAEDAIKKAKDTADAANKAKSEFLANMSHELRTPLNAILGFTQLMSRHTSLSSEIQEYVRIISNSGQHLLGLINEVLELSKIEAGRLTINPKHIDLYELLDSLEEMFHLKARGKGLQLRFNMSSQVPQYVQIDESKLRQVLINILGNAIKFTETGSVTIRISSRPTEKAKEKIIHWEIEDTGMGIAPDELHLLFEPFVQTESGRKSQSGSGLGLPISRKFIELMGGAIAVESTLGKGTIFSFDVKVQLVESRGISSPEKPQRAIGLVPNQTQYRILVVEDRWESRQLLVKLLSSIGFEVKEAENGAVGVKIWENWEPHLIWMDMRMPVMDGYEATKSIRHFPKGHDTVIIALTASALDEERHLVFAAGCDDLVSKPFQEDILLSKMSEHLGVKYLYENVILETSAELSSAHTPSDEKILDILKEMPPGWVKALHNGALAADDQIIGQLTLEIPPQFSGLVDLLKTWVTEFRFDKITDITEKIIDYE